MESKSFDEIMREIPDDWDPHSQTHETRSAPPVSDDHASATLARRDTVPRRLGATTTTNVEIIDNPLRNAKPCNSEDESAVRSPLPTKVNLVPTPPIRSPRPRTTVSSDRTASQSPTPSTTIRNAHTASKVSNVPTTPGTLRTTAGGVSRQSAIAHAQAAVQLLRNPDMNMDINRQRPPAPTSRVSETTTGTSFEDSTQYTSFHDGRVGGSVTTQTSFPEPSKTPDGSPFRRSTRRRRSANSTGDTEGRTRPPRSRPATTRQITISHGNGTEHEGSVRSTGSSMHKRCILADPQKASRLMKLVRELIENEKNCPNDLYEGVPEILWMDEIQCFYDRNACRPADDGPSDETWDETRLKILSRASNELAKIRATIIVNALDKLYFEAGWRLNPGEVGANLENPIRISHSSAPPRRSRAENNQVLSPLPKPPSQRSHTGTSRSVKLSKQHSAQRTFPSAASDSQTSFSRSQTSTRFLCFCRKESSSLKKFKRHYDTHFPLYFYACVYMDCDFVTARPGNAVEHYESCTLRHRSSSTNNELGHNDVKQKFSIPDSGHEMCIYTGCDAFFGGNGKMSKEHIIDHQKKHTFEDLRQRLNHRCSDNCGGKGHWKISEYVVHRERRVPMSADKDNGETDASDGGDGSGSSGPSGDEGGQQSGHNSQQNPGPQGGRSDRTSNNYGSDWSTRRGTIGESHFGYNPYNSRRSATDHPAKTAAARTEDYVQNKTMYTVAAELIPTYSTVDARQRHMAAAIKDMEARYEPQGSRGNMLDRVSPSPSIDGTRRYLQPDLEGMEDLVEPRSRYRDMRRFD